MELLGNPVDILLRLSVAVVLGGVVGLEREWRRKAAGLRTHMMVSLGSATFTVVALEMYQRLVLQGDEATRMDPIRLIEGIIGGIGFLGAGAIIQSRGSVEGLTTAGSLWMVGAVGVAAGGGHHVIAVLSVLLGLVVLQGVGHLERRLHSRVAPPEAGGTDPEE